MKLGDLVKMNLEKYPDSPDWARRGYIVDGRALKDGDLGLVIGACALVGLAGNIKVSFSGNLTAKVNMNDLEVVSG